VSRLRILLLEDSPHDAELVGARLAAEGLDVEIERVETRDAYLASLADRPPDAILSDYSLPTYDGLEALEAARAVLPDVPFIFVSGALGEERAVDALTRGATDYVIKDRLDRLAPALRRAAREDEDRRGRIAAEEAFKESERRLRIAIDAADLGTWEWDLAAGTVAWSERTARLFGFDLASFDGTFATAVERIHPDDRARVIAALDRATADGTIYEADFRVTPPEGERWLATRGQLSCDPSGAMTRMAGVCVDVTERMRTEELRAEAFAREQQARMQLETAGRAKDEFLAMVSHELRTPLNSMLGWVRLLRTGRLDAETTARAIETIERNVKSQAQLIEDLLDVSRIISGKLRVNTQPLAPYGFVGAAADTVRPAAEAKGIALEIASEPSMPLVLGDPERLQQVVWNLLSNAVKFTPNGGRVDVRLGRVGSSVEIEVADTGQGIPEAFLPYVFDPFRQADGASTRVHKGLGLGLAIVRHLVELHGGTVSVASGGVGLGSSFRVRLPAAATVERTDAPESADDELARLPVLGGVRVLVVDDEPDTREMLQLSLEQAGAAVVAASGAQEARDALDRDAFDVLVSDIGMPNEDGYALIRSVRARGDAARGMPAIALTAFARAEDRVHALTAGFQMHVAKPVEPIELAMTIKNLVGLTGHRESGERGA
jgi:PAS domain S-box-containing protein